MQTQGFGAPLDTLHGAHATMPGMRTSEPSEVASFAATLSEAFLLCRELGHNWRPYTAEWNGDMRVYERQIRCQRCRTIRRQTLSSSGEILSSSYVYADGYEHKGFGRIVGEGRDVLRLESLGRALAEHATKPRRARIRKAS